MGMPKDRDQSHHEPEKKRVSGHCSHGPSNGVVSACVSLSLSLLDFPFATSLTPAYSMILRVYTSWHMYVYIFLYTYAVQPYLNPRKCEKSRTCVHNLHIKNVYGICRLLNCVVSCGKEPCLSRALEKCEQRFQQWMALFVKDKVKGAVCEGRK